ncbi:MAG: dephospho-CoA kinase [Oscillospiraceae bacterium]|nr:dephospho-CoA kinase [Oscillospiraceae bacterium]
MFPGSSFYFIGLAGKSGAGKSEAARLLREMGCAVLDGDQLAREATLPGSPVLKELAEAFGADILRGDGSLDRALLAERAFRSEEKRRILNDITHPAIAELMEERVRALPEDTPAVVIDAAALHESEYAARCDRLLILTAPEETCLRRILAREGISGEAARRRLAAQRHWEQERPGALYYHNDDKASLEDMRSFLKGVLRDARRA